MNDNKKSNCPICGIEYLPENLEDQICMMCGYVNTPSNFIPANSLVAGQKINIEIDGYISGPYD